MNNDLTPTNFDFKTGMKVVAGFLVMSLVIVVLASVAFSPQTGSPLPENAETVVTSPTDTPKKKVAERPEANEPEEIAAVEAASAENDQQEVIEQPELEKTAKTELPNTEPAEAPIRQNDAAEKPIRTATAISDIPPILSESDTELYRRVFSLQKRGKIKEATKIDGQIDNKLLMGHVLAQRLQRQALPSYKSLRSWMRKYSGHPNYSRLKRLAQARKKGRSRSKRAPAIRRNSLLAAPPRSAPYRTRKNLTRKQRKRVSNIKRTARIWLRRGLVTRTAGLLRRPYVVRLLDRYELDEVRGKVAAAWFYHGNNKKAYRLASKVIARSGKKLPMTHWIAGLASWEMGKVEQALGHFEKLAVVPDLSGWIGAGGALWAAKAHAKLGNEYQERRWLEEAAKHPYTLYGVLALATLERSIPFEPHHHPLTAKKLKLLASTKGGRRALALSQVGQLLRAEQELLHLREWKRPGMTAAMRAFADHLEFPSIALKLTRHSVKDNDDGRAGEPIDPALFPMPPWRPPGKTGIDQALLLAIMRQESDFNAYAHSPVGALGLMQIMPATARMLNRGRRPFSGTRRLDKYDPKIIVKFGERYLTHLRTHKMVRNDLIRVIAAYNSGPGNINYWAKKKIKNKKDPLLFIESIPNLETRLFVRRVFANLWIYRARLNQRAPSLEALAAGKFPRYKPIDGKRKRRAAAEINRKSGG